VGVRGTRTIPETPARGAALKRPRSPGTPQPHAKQRWDRDRCSSRARRLVSRLQLCRLARHFRPREFERRVAYEGLLSHRVRTLQPETRLAFARDCGARLDLLPFANSTQWHTSRCSSPVHFIFCAFREVSTVKHVCHGFSDGTDLRCEVARAIRRRFLGLASWRPAAPSLREHTVGGRRVKVSA
jgi:hypothetical protein